MTPSLLPHPDSALPAIGDAPIADGRKSGLMDMIEQQPEVSIAINLLAPGIQLRAGGTDPAHVRLLADAADSVRLPGILVQKNNSRVIDGKHRVEVAKLRGELAIRARIADCTDAEALVLAIQSSMLHGLPLSRADRICGAKRVLAAHPDLSDRAVAAVTGLSAKPIASFRNSLADDAQFSGKRLGRDGKRHPIMPAEGRRRASEYIAAHPEASLRQIAREADVSLGTAHVIKSLGTAHVIKEKALSEAPAPMSPVRPSAVAVAGGSGPWNWPAISARLASDPALRYTEGGRSFLRWMSGHCLGENEWQEFVDAIPERWLPDISKIAVGMSEEWRQFAEKLGTKAQASAENSYSA
jgi:hypothetical protein